ncbi:HlyU family transcriptional regulator [Loktanella sp. DJP18]|uniref:HlyU family transcriptional regulator n=1 Tax=Loktanella sp. DJP18 TaxID=3409788 RepID=UPI003BB7605B
MSWLSKIFGGKDGEADAAPSDQVNAEVYKDLRIVPEPIKDGQVWRIAARITGEVDGVTRAHHMIRADTLASQEAAATASVAKAKQMIDEQGMRVLD